MRGTSSFHCHDVLPHHRPRINRANDIKWNFSNHELRQIISPFNLFNFGHSNRLLQKNKDTNQKLRTFRLKQEIWLEKCSLCGGGEVCVVGALEPARQGLRLEAQVRVLSSHGLPRPCPNILSSRSIPWQPGPVPVSLEHPSAWAPLGGGFQNRTLGDQFQKDLHSCLSQHLPSPPCWRWSLWSQVSAQRHHCNATARSASPASWARTPSGVAWPCPVRVPCGNGVETFVLHYTLQPRVPVGGLTSWLHFLTSWPQCGLRKSEAGEASMCGFLEDKFCLLPFFLLVVLRTEFRFPNC
jgi:hypothetical protein